MHSWPRTMSGSRYFEGVIKRDFKLILSHFITENVITYGYVYTKYEIAEKQFKAKLNLPHFTPNQSSIPGTAFENFYFVILFPLIMRGR